MFNFLDEVVQKLLFNGLELEIKNRNIISEEAEDFGFKKKIKDSYLPERDMTGGIFDKFQQQKYEMSWTLLLSIEQLTTFFQILSAYKDKNSRMQEESYYFYTGSASYTNSQLILEDNRIKDYFTGNYESYSISITNIEELILFNAEKETYKLKFSAETLN